MRERKQRSRAGKITRRVFLIAGGTVLGGLGVGAVWLSRQGLGTPESWAKGGAEGASALNAWVRVEPDGRIVIATPRAEMGQGAQTGLAMLVAEELDAPMSRIETAHPDVDGVYANAALPQTAAGLIEDVDNPLRWAISKAVAALPLIVTGGSTSIPDGWITMRRAGAAAREMLREAAARRWGVSASEVSTADAAAIGPDGARLDYAELAAEAAQLDPPSDPPLRAPSDFRVIGTRQPRLDIPAKVVGETRFGVDVDAQTVGGELLIAAMRHAPVKGGRVVGFDAEEIQRRRGVIAVMETPGGVAVVADNTWRAMSAARDLPIEVDDGGFGALSSAEIEAGLKAELDREPGHVAEDIGDVDAALESAATIVEADYAAPFLAHACMEPMNATVRVNWDKTAEVWAPSQSPTIAQFAVAAATEVSASDVRVTITSLGGGFGRRAEGDVIAQAAMVAQAFKGRAVKMVWSREEDMRNDVYRPAAAARFRGGLDAEGRILGLDARLASQAVEFEFSERSTPFGGFSPEASPLNVEGAAKQPYAYGACRIGHRLTASPIPVGFWRSVGHSQNAFFKESFIDELAHAAGADPVAFRRAHLTEAPRHLAVLDAAAEAAGWGRSLPAGRGLGVAVHESFRSIVAQVVEVDVSGGDIRVESVWSAVDCGVAINPDSVEAQIQSGIIYGLTAALYGRIDVEDGQVVQGNFPDYEMVRLATAPREMPVTILPSEAYPGGVGEIGLPPLAPALANAVFAANGRRLRSMPFEL